MGKLRGTLKSGYYITSRKEKVYVSEIKNGEVVYGGKGGRDAMRFTDGDTAYNYLDEHDLRKSHKVIQVR